MNVPKAVRKPKIRVKAPEDQGILFESEYLKDGQTSSEKRFTEVFRKLYYHFYSNSNASRAERIVHDLSNLLLCKIAAERNGGREAVNAFLSEAGTANETLLPVLLERFPRLKAEAERFTLSDEILRLGLRELTALELRSAEAHVLGEAFQALIGPRLRGDKGQFFTPRTLVRAMVTVLQPRTGEKIVDPAAGTGGFLLEVLAYLQQSTGNLRPPSQIIGIDKDADLARLCQAVLEAATDNQVSVLNQSSLDIEALKRLPDAESPWNADLILTNPPFGAKIKITERAILSQFDLGYRWTFNGEHWIKNGGIRDAQDPQVLFIELCIRLLKLGGRLGIVLPEGIFGNHSQGYILDFIRSAGRITALLDCPRTTFQPSTDTKTNVLFFEKGTPTTQPTQVRIAVALSCGHDRRGRNTKLNGEPYPDDFRLIGQAAIEGAESAHWQTVSITEPYYLVPRYYDRKAVDELRQEADKLQAVLVSLGDLIKQGAIKVKKGHEVGAEVYGTGDVPFVRTSDISNYEISIDPTKSVSEDVYALYKDQQSLKPGDILVVADGRYRIGRTAILNEFNFRCIVQSHIRILTVKQKSPLAAIELLYLLNLPVVQHQIRNLVFVQSTLGALGKRLGEILIPLPKKTDRWAATVKEFDELIQGRAQLLRRLQAFEPVLYEL